MFMQTLESKGFSQFEIIIWNHHWRLLITRWRHSQSSTCVGNVNTVNWGDLGDISPFSHGYKIMRASMFRKVMLLRAYSCDNLFVNFNSIKMCNLHWFESESESWFRPSQSINTCMHLSHPLDLRARDSLTIYSRIHIYRGEWFSLISQSILNHCHEFSQALYSSDAVTTLTLSSKYII